MKGKHLLMVMMISMLLWTFGTYAKEKAAIARAGSIWLEANECSDRIAGDLSSAGFGLALERASADTILSVDVHQLDAHTGASARYKAVMRGNGGREFFNTDGREDAISEKKLCKNISGKVVDRVETRLGPQS